MIRRFECKDCNKTFDADDKGYVKCPHCQSDNVDYFKHHLSRAISWLACGIVVAVLIIVFIVWASPFPSSTPTVQPNNEVRDSAEQEIAQKSDSIYIIDGSKIAPSLSISDKVYNDENDTYSCRIVVSYPPQQSWKVIIKSKNGKNVAESEDGWFKNLPYSKEDGFYIVRLVDKKSGAMLCEEREFPDFPKLDIVKHPWSENDLQIMLNSDESLVNNPNIANPHTVIVVNKPKGDTSVTKSLRDVQQLIRQCGLTAKVEKVEHDNLKKICSAKIKIDYPDDWLQESDEY